MGKLSVIASCTCLRGGNCDVVVCIEGQVDRDGIQYQASLAYYPLTIKGDSVMRRDSASLVTGESSNQAKTTSYQISTPLFIHRYYVAALQRRPCRRRKRLDLRRAKSIGDSVQYRCQMAFTTLSYPEILVRMHRDSSSLW